MTDLIRIRTDTLSAAINPFGAELTHLRDADGAELMTDADPAYWPKHAPILFPVIGLTNGGIRLDGTTYPMTKHGFARDLPFTVVEQEADHCTLALTDSAQTRALYPCAFRLEIAFRIEGATLSIAARVANPAETPLLAQFGFHPAFAWPLPYGRARDDHRIVFDRDEPGRLREISPDGLIATATADSPLKDGRTLHLADALFVHDALVWDPVASDAVTYGAPSGPRLRVAFPDTPALGIWTRPGAHFVCIEPWHGIADPEGFTGAFADKPGVFTVAPGDERRIAMSVTLER